MSGSRAEADQVFDLAMRIGEVMLGSGLGAADVTSAVLAVCRAGGISDAEVDITFSTLTISYQPEGADYPFTRMRQLQHRSLNFRRLTEADDVSYRYWRGDLTLEEARRRVADLRKPDLRGNSWLVSLGSGIMGAGVAIMFAGSWLVIATAFVSAMVMDFLTRVMFKRGVPYFFVQMLGGFVGAMIAMVMFLINRDLNPAQVIASAIIVLLAGITSLGAVQDAVSGWYITAGARSFEAFMLTAGLLGGVSGAVAVANRFHVDLTAAPYAVPSLSSIGIQILAAALACLGFLMQNVSPLRAYPAGIAVGAVGQIIYLLVGATGTSVAWAAGLAAVVVGIISLIVARRLSLAPLVLMITGLVPMLPGYMIYRSLTLMSQSDFTGLFVLITAGSVCISLAAGAIFGEYLAAPIARRLKRPQGRLSIPVLAGPFSTTRNLRSLRRNTVQNPRV